MTACQWPVDDTCFPDLPAPNDPTYSVALERRESAKSLAVQVLWALSGRRFGVCTYVVRPCQQLDDTYRFQYQPVTSYVLSWEGDRWVNWPCGCVGRCKESGPRSVHLPGPAHEIVEVIIGGTVLGPDEYVLEGDVLHRIGNIWPPQDLSYPMGEVNTWSVEYLRGDPVPLGVDRLTGLLAKEFITVCEGGRCRLPSTVVSTTRQGVTHQFDPSRIYAAGKTGLPECDQWLAAVNPYRLLEAPSVI